MPLADVLHLAAPFWHPSFLGPAWRRRTVMHAPWSIVRCATPHFFVSLSLWARPTHRLHPSLEPSVQPDARGRRPAGKDSHEIVVQVHQNPNWDSAGTIHGPGEAVAPVCWGPHRWDAARRPVLEAKSQVYEPTRPSTEPEFSPLLLLRNHQMLVTERPCHAPPPLPPQMCYTNATRKNTIWTACPVTA